MPKFEDFRSDPEVRDIMERFVTKFPIVFEGFDVDGIKFISTQKKKASGGALKLRTVAYPLEVFVGAPYVVEMFEDAWNQMSAKLKNTAVFHIMCAFPDGAFDPASKYYGKKVKPQIVMYDMEFAVTGGSTHWMEDPKAKDPMDIEPDVMAANMPAKVEVEDDDPLSAPPAPVKSRHPVTAAGIAGAVAV